jgi:hypothetical protein
MNDIQELVNNLHKMANGQDRNAIAAFVAIEINTLIELRVSEALARVGRALQETRDV